MEKSCVRAKTYRFRLYPTTIQERMLLAWLELCRLLYNQALAERREHYKRTGHGLTYVNQQDALPAHKQEHPEYLSVHSQVLQNVLLRLDRAFTNFFEGRARYPRFKRHGEYASITYPQASTESIGRRSIILSKIGRVRMVKHRPVNGKLKIVTVVHRPNGEWYAAAVAELKDHARTDAVKQAEVFNPVGVDSGLVNYLYLSDGSHVDNPRFIRKHTERMEKTQKRLSRKRRLEKTITDARGKPRTVKAWSNNGLKAKRLLAERWQDYTNAKEDWQWKRANTLVREHDFIAYEDLPIQNMLRNHNLAGAIQDASWAGFWNKVENKAVETDSTRTQKVTPRYTTQMCSRCRHLQLIALSERTYRCQNCSYVAPRDHNSANTILRTGLEASGLRVAQPIGMGMPEYTPVEIGPIQPEAERPMMEASLVVEAGNKFSSVQTNLGEPGGIACGEAHDISRGKMSHNRDAPRSKEGPDY